MNAKFFYANLAPTALSYEFKSESLHATRGHEFWKNPIPTYNGELYISMTRRMT